MLQGTGKVLIRNLTLELTVTLIKVQQYFFQVGFLAADSETDVVSPVDAILLHAVQWN